MNSSRIDLPPESGELEADLEALLRLSPEPYTFFDDRRVHRALTADPRAYLDALLEAIESIAFGRASLELPPKSVFADPGQRSDFRVMPCVVRFPGRTRKTVKIIGTNWPREIVPGEISVGQAFSLHQEENFIEAGFAGCLLSSARTGACVATGLRLLAPDSREVAVVGSGRVGYYAGLFVASLGSVKKVVFADAVEGRAALAASNLGAALPGLETGVFEADSLPATADTLVLATDSETPIFDASGHCPRLVVSVGADTDWQSEITPAVLSHYALSVDTQDSPNYGDLAAFGSHGHLAGVEAVDLFELVRDEGRRRTPALFVSTGSALFDNLTIDYLMSQVESGDGQ
ncbi:MAG: hypothetical protein GVY32_11395 [Gammaproteobacteria bacterium]|jgi:ornithine cyclodeaminase/alanine dehydrogenase-like protein (mu-crystallin family)|nr:hypothetical protein [Gammaproteobacteria bacterium]